MNTPPLLFSCSPSALKHNSGTRLSPVPAEKDNNNKIGEKKKEKEFYALKKKNRKKVMCDVLPRMERGQRLRHTFPGDREQLSQQERSLCPKALVAKKGIL